MINKALLSFMYFLCLTGYSQAQSKTDSASFRSSPMALLQPADSNVLIVINGKMLGPAHSVLGKIDNAFHPESLRRVQLLKGEKAIQKYGEAARHGVLEIELKPVAFDEVKIHEKQKSASSGGSDENTKWADSEKPRFPGGKENFIKFMEQTLNPLVPYEHHAPPGTYKVTVRFYVDENGQLSQFQPVTAHGYGMEEEVIRFLKKSPAWLPARQNGKKTGAFAEQSVNFAVEYDFSLSTYQLKAGQKNRLSVSLTKGKPGEIEIELTDAQITLISPGHFEIIPSKKGKALLTVYERKSKTMKYELGKVWMDIQ